MKRFLYGLAAGALLGLTAACLLWPQPAAAQAEPPAPPVEEGGASGSTRDPGLQVRVTPKMRRFSYTLYTLYFAGTLLNALVLVFLLRSGVSARLRDLAERKARNGLLRAYIYYPLFTLAYGALTLPLAFYGSYLLPHQYGLSTQTLQGWLTDGAKGLGLSSAIGPPVVAMLYWSIRRSPRRWWFGFWLVSIPLLVLAILLAPIVIEPLFSKFGPLKNERLRERILALAAQAGIEHSRVFEVDASRRTKAVNAYVTGIGGSARIVLWDTLLERLDEEEVLSVMAHEMGHYVEKHVPLLLTVSICGTLLLFFLIDRSGRAVLQRCGDRWQVTGLGDMASFPLLLLLLTLLNFAGDPFVSAVSRTIESRADTFGLRLTGNGRAAASAFVKLSELNLSLPDPPKFIELWMFSHPPLQQRIDKALAWPERASDQ